MCGFSKRTSSSGVLGVAIHGSDHVGDREVVVNSGAFIEECQHEFKRSALCMSARGGRFVLVAIQLKFKVRNHHSTPRRVARFTLTQEVGDGAVRRVPAGQLA